MALLGPGLAAPLCLSRQLSARGDYVLGGLFPLGTAADTGLGVRTQPQGIQCTRFSAVGLLWALAVKMAVEEINNSSALLPGLRLGYDLLDTCSEPMVTMKPSLKFLAGVGSCRVAAHCEYIRYRPRVLAVIGPHSSELALITGKFFGFFLMPQVSYGASTDRLSQRESFPSFFRTVPSDREQAVAMVALLRALHWNWVAALGSDDEYGRQGLSLFSSLASTQGICVAHEGLVPLPGPASTPQLGPVLDLLHRVNQSRVQVVVLFASPLAARSLFTHSTQQKLSSKVWVASEAWLTSDQVMSLPDMARAGTVLGFLQRGASVPGFPAYVQRRLALAADPAFCSSLEAEQSGQDEHVLGPRCPQCDHISLDDVSGGMPPHKTFAAYAAVYGVAQALHDALGCGPSGCLRGPLRPWQLLKNLYNVSFRAHGLELSFDAQGNVAMEYDLKLWVWGAPRPELRTVGHFDGRLRLRRNQMRWHTPGNQCSPQCEEGQVRRVKGFHSCCYDCVDCPAGSYQHSPGDTLCRRCAPDQWSPARSPRCFPRTPRILAWGEPVVLVLLALLGLTLSLVLGALGLFLQHRHSPLVRASGGPRACFGLSCLGLGCLGVLLFPGRPSSARCLAQQPLLQLPLTGCLSTLFLQAIQIFAGSALPPGWAGPLQGCLQRAWAWLVVLLALLVQVALCAWFLVAFPPQVVADGQVLPSEMLLQCHQHSWLAFGLVHAPSNVLAALCFLSTFLVRSQPDSHTGARSLTFAALAYLLTWTSYVPLSANVHVNYQPAVEMGATLLSALGILATFHLPLCYMLLRQLHGNTPALFPGEGPCQEGEVPGQAQHPQS
ncbi:taste receptor type 1 member 3 [Sorex fumeus]|uniref:taste receptor type 1 member 3 n=1 Tax=Sorex fumeus TaxID=62283 RepID=UPI0024AE3390|nr:taste receptor type 1 member 3 [Sorex fumeus]